MSLRLILGPMKSGKSFDLIAHFAPLEHSRIKHILYQSQLNEREDSITSRSGLKRDAEKVVSLPETAANYRVIGIDEIHMFPLEDVAKIDALVKQGKEVICSGLDMDYRGKLFPIVKALLELAPASVRYKRAVCEICRSMDGSYTQLFKNDKPLLAGIPSVLVENAAYVYRPVCRKCFVQAE